MKTYTKNIYTPIERASKYIKTDKYQGEINKSTIIVRDSYTSFSITKRTSRQKIKDTLNLSNTINICNLIFIENFNQQQ